MHTEGPIRVTGLSIPVRLSRLALRLTSAPAIQCYLVYPYLSWIQIVGNRNTRGKTRNTGVETKTCSFMSMLLSTLDLTSTLAERLSSHA